mmetsp:Transcript_17639/g.28695  ORF Transcript_17639/g.28695 Transcript_17639/m.28695 type:complete len:81 (+) Transcript_17639:1687-1929(+)
MKQWDCKCRRPVFFLFRFSSWGQQHHWQLIKVEAAATTKKYIVVFIIPNQPARLTNQPAASAAGGLELAETRVFACWPVV